MALRSVFDRPESRDGSVAMRQANLVGSITTFCLQDAWGNQLMGSSKERTAQKKELKYGMCFIPQENERHVITSAHLFHNEATKESTDYAEVRFPSGQVVSGTVAYTGDFRHSSTDIAVVKLPEVDWMERTGIPLAEPVAGQCWALAELKVPNIGWQVFESELEVLSSDPSRDFLAVSGYADAGYSGTPVLQRGKCIGMISRGGGSSILRPELTRASCIERTWKRCLFVPWSEDIILPDAPLENKTETDDAAVQQFHDNAVVPFFHDNSAAAAASGNECWVPVQASNTVGSAWSVQTITDQSPEGTYKAVQKYMKDLTDMARQGKLDPVIGQVNQHLERDYELRHRGSSQEIVSKWTGIPSEMEKLLHIEDELHRRVVGQEPAVQAVADAIRRSRAGLSDPNRPIASFMFMGPTGVGKTELAKALAAYLFNTEEALIRIDMSEYTEKLTVSRLIGASPGYVGYEGGGQLSNSVVLLADIDKARSDAFNIFLQILDAGSVTDFQGWKINFKNSVVIMSSNIGAQIILSSLEAGEPYDRMEKRVMDLARHKFGSHVLNRIDDCVVFKALKSEDMMMIFKLQLAQVEHRLKYRKLGLTVSEAAFEVFQRMVNDVSLGAWMVKRVVQQQVENPIAKRIIRGEYKEDDIICVNAASTGHGQTDPAHDICRITIDVVTPGALDTRKELLQEALARLNRFKAGAWTLELSDETFNSDKIVRWRQAHLPAIRRALDYPPEEGYVKPGMRSFELDKLLTAAFLSPGVVRGVEGGSHEHLSVVGAACLNLFLATELVKCESSGEVFRSLDKLSNDSLLVASFRASGLEECVLLDQAGARVGDVLAANVCKAVVAVGFYAYDNGLEEVRRIYQEVFLAALTNELG